MKQYVIHAPGEGLHQIHIYINVPSSIKIVYLTLLS